MCVHVYIYVYVVRVDLYRTRRGGEGGRLSFFESRRLDATRKEHNSLFGSSLQFKKAFVSVTGDSLRALASGALSPFETVGGTSPSSPFSRDVEPVINPLLLNSLPIK